VKSAIDQHDASPSVMSWQALAGEDFERVSGSDFYAS
jgi:hypothetical protein